MDIKDMPQSDMGFKHILICTCESTNFTVGVAIKNTTSKAIFDALFARVICLFGQPSVIISDKGSGMISNIIQEMYKKLRIRPYTVNPANHGSNRTERYIQTINNMIKKYLMNEGNEWPLYVQPCIYAMNTFVSPQTGYSPYEMVFIRPPPSLSEITRAPHEEQVTQPVDEYLKKQQKKLNFMAKMVMEDRKRQQMTQMIDQQRRNLDEHKYGKGDLVMIRRPYGSELQTKTKKLIRPWIGPVRIQTVLSPHKYLISDWEGHMTPITIDSKELKPYYMSDPDMKIGDVSSELKSVLSYLGSNIQINDQTAESPNCKTGSTEIEPK